MKLEVFFKTKISKYDSAFSKTENICLLIDELNLIKSGYYAKEIELCRKLYSNSDFESYKKAKSKLPAVTFCGVFHNGHKVENLIEYNNFLVIDIDKLSNNEILGYKNKLGSDKYIAAMWFSPSGFGLKGLVKLNITPEFHKFAFDQFSEYFRDTYNIEIDKSGSDISRLCFVSWDKDLIINENAEIFPFDSTKLIEKTPRESDSQNQTSLIEIVNTNQKALFYQTEGRNDKRNRELIYAIIKYLNKKNLSITQSHNDWVRVGFVIANTFTFDIGRKYFLKLCRLDEDNHDEEKSQNLIEYCYRNRKLNSLKFATLVYLAKNKGFKSK
jgi:VirE N-terminal domain